MNKLNHTKHSPKIMWGCIASTIRATPAPDPRPDRGDSAAAAWKRCTRGVSAQATLIYPP
jgi:hypothetical protein